MKDPVKILPYIHEDSPIKREAWDTCNVRLAAIDASDGYGSPYPILQLLRPLPECYALQVLGRGGNDSFDP